MRGMLVFVVAAALLWSPSLAADNGDEKDARSQHGAQERISRYIDQRCNNTRAAVLMCALHFFDVNDDGQITRQELEATLPTLHSMPSPLIDVDYIMQCDMDGDNVLTMQDWSPPVSSGNVSRCLPTYACVELACRVCKNNGFSAIPQDGNSTTAPAQQRSVQQDASGAAAADNRRRMDAFKSAAQKAKARGFRDEDLEPSTPVIVGKSPESRDRAEKKHQNDDDGNAQREQASKRSK